MSSTTTKIAEGADIGMLSQLFNNLNGTKKHKDRRAENEREGFYSKIPSLSEKVKSWLVLSSQSGMQWFTRDRQRQTRLQDARLPDAGEKPGTSLPHTRSRLFMYDDSIACLLKHSEASCFHNYLDG